MQKMKEYHKIQSVYNRDLTSKKKPFIEGQWAKPETVVVCRRVKWVWTEKIDGTNLRAQWNSKTGNVLYSGRQDSSQIPSPLVNLLNSKLTSDRFHAAFIKPEDVGKDVDITVCLYGEGYGAKVQLRQ